MQTDHESEAVRPVDLSVDPDTMLEIRERVREELVQRVHAHRISARVLRKFGKLELAREQEERAEETIRMIATLEDSNQPPGDVHLEGGQ